MEKMNKATKAYKQSLIDRHTRLDEDIKQVFIDYIGKPLSEMLLAFETLDAERRQVLQAIGEVEVGKMGVGMPEDE